jgi:hypothetical protein
VQRERDGQAADAAADDEDAHLTPRCTCAIAPKVTPLRSSRAILCIATC